MASGVDLQTAKDIYSLFIAHFVGIAFFYYDYLTTLGDEINFIWLRPKTQSAYWFAVNRYLAVFSNIVVTVLRSWSLPEESCRAFNWFRQIALFSNQIVVCILLTIRTYALYGCSRRILFFMLGCGAVLIGVSGFSVAGQSSSHAATQLGCHLAFSQSTSVRLAVPWEALFVYDTIVFGLTISKSYQLSRRRVSLFSSSIPLLSLIVRDGALYFAIMALANLANILTFYFSGPHMRGGLTTFSSCISVTLVSRLMLNLHRSADQGVFTNLTSDHSTSYTDSRMRFTSRIGTETCPSVAYESGWEMRNMTPFSDDATLRSPTLAWSFFGSFQCHKTVFVAPPARSPCILESL